MERQLQDALAGHPGRERRRRDARGRGVTVPDLLESSQPGKNVYLTLDAKLQAAAVDLLGGRTGSIILMDAQTGALLVLASTPSFDPHRPGATQVRGRDAGFINLAHRGLYPPGSTFKIVGAAAVLREGIPADHTIECRGSFRLPGWDRAFYCANRLGHGPMNLWDSLKYSCNVYYYELGPLLGSGPILEMGRSFGFGEPTGLDLPGERAGQLTGAVRPTAGQLTNLVIGQGDMLVTPLQMVRAFAPIANREGTLPTPHVVRGLGLEDPGSESRDAPPGERIPLSRSQIAEIVEGLRRAVNEPGGTSHRAGFPRGWNVAGKTGSAQNPQGTLDAWFVGFFPHEGRDYVVLAHLVEQEAGGGEIAAPVARDMIRFLKEGPLQEPEDGPELASREGEG